MSTRARRRRSRTALPAIVEAGDPADGVFAPRVYVGRLRSSADWARELSKLYRQMRKGEVPLAAGTKLAFVARVAAVQTRLVEELEQYREVLQEWRRAHSSEDAPLPQLSDPFDDALIPDTSSSAAEQAAITSE